MASGTPASMAVDSPPRRAGMPEKPSLLNPTSASLATIIAEISGDVAWRDRSKLVPFFLRHGKSGGQTWQGTE
jgi:hypothetical protein